MEIYTGDFTSGQILIIFCFLIIMSGTAYQMGKEQGRIEEREDQDSLGEWNEKK